MFVLKFNWNNLLQELSVDLPLGEKVFQDLCNAYSHPERHYHNLKHIQQVLDVALQMQFLANNFPAIQLTAWFHDFVCNPKANDNEAKSAIYTEAILSQLQIDSATIKLVKRIILDTQTHQADADNIDSLIFLDADISILGSSKEKYKTYAAAIRQEYAWLSDAEYRLGRTKILTNFLARERVYTTEFLFNKLEKQARLNMEAEITALCSEGFDLFLAQR